MGWPTKAFPGVVRGVHMGTPGGGRGRGLLEGEGALGANSEQLQSGWGAL